MNIKRLNIKTDDAGFSDVWYTTGKPGDELTPAQAYSHVGIVRRPVDLLANAVQSLPYQIEIGEENVEELEPVNFDKVRNVCATDAVVFGAYYLKPEMVGGRIALTRLLPSTVKYIYTGGRLDRFERQGPNGAERYAPDELIYWWEDNFQSEIGPGASLLQSAMVDANLVNAGGKFSLAWYMRGGPLTLLRADGNILDPEVRKIERWWERISIGFKSWFRGVVIRAGLIEPVIFGGDMKSADSEKTMRAAEERLAAAIGVPLSLIYSNASTFATAQQDERNLISYAAAPLARRIFEPLNVSIFGPAGAELEFYPERASAFSETTWDKVDSVIKARDAGLITTEYAQEILGLPETEPVVTAPPAPVATPVPVLDVEEPEQIDIPAQSMAALSGKAAWQRKALNALEREKSPAVSFASDSISAREHAAITEALKTCRTADDVRAVFATTPAQPQRDSMAKLADEIKAARQMLEKEQTVIHIHNTPPAVTVNSAPIKVPAPLAPQVNVNVEPAPVTVIDRGPSYAKVTRNAKGEITGIQSE